MEKKNNAIYYGEQINCICRWAKNGRKYVWNNPTQEKLDYLVNKYGVEQIAEDTLWLEW